MNPKYSIHIIWSNEDRAFIACVPELPGCRADGKTPEAALAELHAVAEEWVETAKSMGRPIPKGFTTEDYDAMAKKFRKELALQVKREVEAAVSRVLADLAHFNPVLTGGRDPADYWKSQGEIRN